MRSMPWRGATAASLLAAALVCLVPGPGWARTPDGFTTHRVEEGETLPSIAAIYLRTPRQWPLLQKLNRIQDPNKIAAGTLLQIPARLLKPGAINARVEFVRGSPTAVSASTTAGATALRKPARGAAEMPAPASAVAEPLTVGNTLVEGAKIQVPEDGYLLLRLADGSIVRILAGSDVELKRLRRRGAGADSFESVIDVRGGKVESEVSKQPKGRVFEIHAPGAVASVRGTHFDVAVGPDGRTGTSVSEGTVAVQGRKPVRGASRDAPRGATTITAGQGVMVEGNGKLGTRRSLPATPDLTALPGEYQDADQLVFDLGESEAAARHEVRIARDGTFREVLRDGTFTGRSVKFTALDDGDYTLGVRSVDADGLAGAEASRTIRIHARPVPPLYQSPTPGARVTSEAAQLVCSEVAGTEVHLQVSSRADFSQPEVDQPGLSRCRLGLATLPLGDYYWRVASVQTPGLGHGPFAAPQRFSLVATPKVDNLDVADAGDTPTLSWSATAGHSFHGQVAKDEAFKQVVLEADLSAPRWTISGVERGAYYVRLRARDAAGAEGPYSPPRRLRIGGVVQTSTGGGVISGDGEPLARP
ncbi:MAG: hypothetical protein JWQ73_515 [Variovorax sp.]|nr:hypothetical protein [Variovorax sp.]